MIDVSTAGNLDLWIATLAVAMIGATAVEVIPRKRWRHKLVQSERAHAAKKFATHVGEHLNKTLHLLGIIRFVVEQSVGLHDYVAVLSQRKAATKTNPRCTEPRSSYISYQRLRTAALS